MFGQFVVHLDYMLSAATARRPAPCGQCGASAQRWPRPPAHARRRASSIEFRDVRPEKGRYAGPPAPAKTHGSGEFLSDRRESKARRRGNPAAAFEAADVRPARYQSRCERAQTFDGSPRTRRAVRAGRARPVSGETRCEGSGSPRRRYHRFSDRARPRPAGSVRRAVPWSAGSAARAQTARRGRGRAVASGFWSGGLWRIRRQRPALRGKRQPGRRSFVGVRPGQPRGLAAGRRQPPGLPAGRLLQGLRSGCATVHRRGLRHRPLGAAGRRGKIRGRMTRYPGRDAAQAEGARCLQGGSADGQDQRLRPELQAGLPEHAQLGQGRPPGRLLRHRGRRKRHQGIPASLALPRALAPEIPLPGAPLQP